MTTLAAILIAALVLGYFWHRAVVERDSARAELAATVKERDDWQAKADEWRAVAADWQGLAKRSLPPAPMTDLEWARLRKAVGL